MYYIMYEGEYSTRSLPFRSRIVSYFKTRQLKEIPLTYVTHDVIKDLFEFKDISLNTSINS